MIIAVELAMSGPTLHIETLEAKQEFLARCYAEFSAVLGPRLRDVVLFGSFARNEAEEHSDVDLLLFMDSYQRMRDWGLLADATRELFFETGHLIQPIFVTPQEFYEYDCPLHRNVLSEGVWLDSIRKGQMAAGA